MFFPPTRWRQRWLSEQCKSFKQKLTEWRSERFSLFLKQYFWWFFSPCRLHCWQRRARRLEWRRTWSTLFRASATSNYCFFSLPPCSAKASGTCRSWSLGVSYTLVHTSLGDIWRSLGPISCEQTLAKVQRGFVLENLKCRHARRSVQSRCPVNN